MRFYAFSGRFKFAVFKISKTASKNVNLEEHEQYENKEHEAFEIVFILLF